MKHKPAHIPEDDNTNLDRGQHTLQGSLITSSTFSCTLHSINICLTQCLLSAQSSAVKTYDSILASFLFRFCTHSSVALLLVIHQHLNFILFLNCMAVFLNALQSAVVSFVRQALPNACTCCVKLTLSELLQGFYIASTQYQDCRHVFGVFLLLLSYHIYSDIRQTQLQVKVIPRRPEAQEKKHAHNYWVTWHSVLRACHQLFLDCIPACPEQKQRMSTRKQCTCDPTFTCVSVSRVSHCLDLRAKLLIIAAPNMKLALNMALFCCFQKIKPEPQLMAPTNRNCRNKAIYPAVKRGRQNRVASAWLK